MNLNTIAALFHNPFTEQIPLTGICIDSRQVKAGNLFVALRGERFDGHDFIEEAVAKGAAAILCNQANPKINVPQLEVPDTLQASARIASHHRQSITCPIIAL